MNGNSCIHECIHVYMYTCIHEIQCANRLLGWRTVSRAIYRRPLRHARVDDAIPARSGVDPNQTRDRRAEYRTGRGPRKVLIDSQSDYHIS